MQIQKLDTFGGHRDAVYALAPGPAPGQFFSAGADGQVARWNLHRPDLGALVARVPASVYALAFDATSERLWVGQNYEGLHVIDTRTNAEVASLKLTTAAIFDIVLHEGTAYVALSDGVVAVVDVAQMAVRKHLKAAEKSARCLALNVASGELAVGYSDHRVRIFDLATLALKHVITGHTNSVFTVAYSPDGQRLLSAGRDAHLRVWDVASGYTPQQDVVAHLFAINHVAFSPDGQLLATASMDKAVKIWAAGAGETATLKLLKVVDRARHAGHGTSVNRLLWMGDDRLISASDDRTLSVWQVAR